MVFFGNLFHKNVDTQIVMSYIWKRFEVHVSPDWVSDWMVAMHLSSRKVRYASASKMNQQTFLDMISFQESIKYLTEIQKVGPEQIYFVDKMYVGDKPKARREQHWPKGIVRESLSLSVVVQSAHFRPSAVVTCALTRQLMTDPSMRSIRH